MLAKMFSMSLLTVGIIFPGASVATAGGDQSDGLIREYRIEIRVEYPGEIQIREGRDPRQRAGQDHPVIKGHYTPFSPEIFSPYGRTVR